MSEVQLSTPALTTAVPQQRRRARKRRDVYLGDRVFHRTLWLLGTGVLFLLLSIAFQIFELSLPALKKFGLSFLIGQDWNPVDDSFGALPVIFGTVVSSLLALFLAAPTSIGVALFLTELVPRKVATTLGFLVEMLAAIPSVVYGLWGIFVLAPWLRVSVEPFLGKYLGFIPLFTGPPFGVGMLAAGMILAIMITPTITAFCREVFRAVPRHQREAALALGATRWEMMRLSILKASRTGILGGVILGLGRALGETMAVAMVIGNRPTISASLFSPAQTMASVIANEYAEATSDLHHSSLALVGLALFLVSLLINSIARFFVWRAEKIK